MGARPQAGSLEQNRLSGHCLEGSVSGCHGAKLWYSPATGLCLSFRASDRCLIRKSYS